MSFEAQAHGYLHELDRWSRVSRLTAYPTEPARVRHLLLDSLLFLAVLPREASPLLDVGSGAGVPGLVLKLARPGWRVELVEANRRRANFLRHVVRTLGLTDLAVHEARAEALGGRPELRAAFAAVTLRAVAAPAAATALAHPFLRPDGVAVIALASGAAVATLPAGRIETVALPAGVGLRLERRFLILPADASSSAGASDVPRETSGGAWRGF